jgi:hypothetical protein
VHFVHLGSDQAGIEPALGNALDVPAKLAGDLGLAPDPLVPAPNLAGGEPCALCIVSLGIFDQ